MTTSHTSPEPLAGHPHDLVGAWVLDALQDDERSEFEAHVAGCDACRAEAASLREAVVALAADAAPVAPPPALRDAVLATIDQTPQVLPSRAEPTDASDTLRSPASPPSTTAPVQVSAPETRQATTPARQTLASRLGLGLAAALVLVLGGVGIWAQGVRGELADQQASNQAVAAVLADPESSVLRDDASVLVLSGDGQAVFTSASVDAPAGQVLQLWVIDQDGPVSAGLVTSPTTATLLETPVPPGAVVGVTVEPEGGSPAPTSDPVIAFAT